MYSKKGLISFMNLLTINEKYYMILPIELREIIWKFAHIYPVIECFICDKVLFHLEINLLKNNESSDNYTIINGLTKCNKCMID